MLAFSPTFALAHVDVFVYIPPMMTGAEFIRKLRRLGRRNGVEVAFETHKGKGSHGTVHYGNRRTTVKDRKAEIGRGLLRAMCRDLGIDPNDLE